MNIGKSISFVFEDQKWIEKILIGGLIGLVPIVGPLFLLGYMLKLVRNVRNGVAEPLPEWTDWGDLLIDGLKYAVVVFIWALPLIILYLFAFIPSALAGDSSSDASAIASFFAICFGCFAFLYAILLSLASPAILIKYAETSDIAAGLNVGAVLNFTKTYLGEIILVVIVGWAIGLVAGLIGLLLCVIGVIFTGFWGNLVYAHMAAQIGMEASAPERPLETLATSEPPAELPEASPEE